MTIALARPLTRVPVDAAPTDPDAFLRWAEGREGRYELAGGQVTMMVGATIRHEKIVARITHLLGAVLDRQRFTVGSGGLAVRTSAGIRYPDVTVHEGPFDPTDLEARRPVLVVEVLSPSSLTADLIEKPADYAGVPSIATYLAFAQEEPRALVWRREAGRFPALPEERVGAESAVPLPDLGLAIPLAEAYAGLSG